MLAPLVLYMAFFLFPSLLGLFYSFTDWGKNTPKMGLNFVGFKNYVEIFTSNKNYADGILHTLKFTVVSNLVKIIPALFLAIILFEGIRGMGAYRTVFYLPSIIPFVIIGILFTSVLNYKNGMLNGALEAIGLGALKQKWLSDLNVVWRSIYMVDAWRGMGYVMTIFMTGLSTIDRTYYEAAKVDGANFWQRLWHVTLPMMRGAIMINLVFGVTYGLKVFDIVYVLTNGGPGHATEVMTTYSFQLYGAGQYGLSTAFNSILLLITAIAGILIVRVMSRKGEV